MQAVVLAPQHKRIPSKSVTVLDLTRAELQFTAEHCGSLYLGKFRQANMAGEVLDVAVVGGGPAGLACAFALCRAFGDIKIRVGVSLIIISTAVAFVRLTWSVNTFQVFERASRYRECGAGISLDINGLKSLQAIDRHICEDFQRSVCSIQQGRMTDKEGGCCSMLHGDAQLLCP